MENSAYALGSVAVASTPQTRFEEFLQSRGKRMTHQRRVIVDHVFSRHEHFDAESLLEMLRQSGKARDASRPTVYRTLNELEESGLLRKMNLNGRFVYEHDYGYPEHDHLHCERCNRLIEFHSPELAKLREAVAQEYQFRASGHRWIITGICADCAKVRRPTRRVDLI